MALLMCQILWFCSINLKYVFPSFEKKKTQKNSLSLLPKIGWSGVIIFFCRGDNFAWFVHTVKKKNLPEGLFSWLPWFCYKKNRKYTHTPIVILIFFVLTTDIPCCCSQRWILAYTSFFGVVLVYAVRVNLSVAIVCMVKNVNSTTELNGTSIDSNTCPGHAESQTVFNKV